MSKTLKEIYKHCYKCGGNLHETEIHSFKCKSCGNETFIDPSIGVMGIIENDNGQILMIERAKDPFKGTWDVPAGFVDVNDENAEATIKREAREEVGVEIDELKYLGSYMHTYEFKGVTKPHISIVFTGKLKSNEISMDKAEIMNAQFISKDKIPFEKIGFPHVKLALEEFINKK
ncbi:MAG: NUDIX domain-containing protein [Candidatus Dojkabacteria bacterium]